MKKISKNKDRYYYYILGLIFLIGIVFRTVLYLYNRSLWLDESFLAFCTIDLPYKNFFTVMHHPSVPQQAAAPFFMVISKFVVQKFGTGEWAFRLFPYLCSIISVPVFYFFCKKFLEKRYSVLVALFLFSINLQLLYYAQEFKQYGTDVLFVMLVILIFYNLKLCKIKNIIGWSLLLCSFFWFSHPAAFTVTICGLVYLVLNFKENKIKLFTFFAPLFVNGLAFIIYALKLSANSFLKQYWEPAFIYALPDFLYKFNQSFVYFFQPNQSLFPLILFVLGTVVFVMQKRAKTLYLYAPLLFTIFLAMLKVYPYQIRLVLFLLPIVLIIIVKPLDKYKIASVILFILAFWHYFYLYPAKVLNRWSYSNEEIRPLAYTLKYNIQDDDIVYVPASSISQLELYDRFIKIGAKHYVTDKQFQPFGHVQNAQKTLEQLEVGKNYWLVSAHSGPQLNMVNDVIADFVYEKCKIIKAYDYKTSGLYYVKKIKQ